jgi:hypothetical protein
MAFALANELNSHKRVDAQRAFQALFQAEWDSGLGLDNGFTATLVLRTLGVLKERGILDEVVLDKTRDYFKTSKDQTPSDIAQLLGGDPQKYLVIKEYPLSPAVMYWFMDGILRARLRVEDSKWAAIKDWAINEFNHQRSVVEAKDDVLMDPVAMAMAACLCSRLHRAERDGLQSVRPGNGPSFPSAVELRRAINVLFALQGPSGIWPKYFPLFHYPEAGSNFCFTFEMLEAVLESFGEGPSPIVEDEGIFAGLDRAVEWCVQNRCSHPYNDVVYHGWNSGGEIRSLRDGKPESWATAVVYMYLQRLTNALDSAIQELILKKYSARLFDNPNDDKWIDLLDMDVTMRSGEPSTVKNVLETEIVTNAESFDPTTMVKMNGRVSALLFGPPGTSKTGLVTALAAKIGWPLVEVDPSQFLANGLDQIYGRSNEIFADLSDLRRVVVFFDEMDAFVRTRQDTQGTFNLTSRFLTTSMLPKLTGLHDRRQVLFFFATNFQAEFDSAIKRPGRFDVLLCVGPPTWDEKVRRLEKFVGRNVEDELLSNTRIMLKSLYGKLDEDISRNLDYLTFGETKSFLEGLAGADTNLCAAISTCDKNSFDGVLREFGKTITLRRLDKDDVQTLPAYELSRYLQDMQESRCQ